MIYFILYFLFFDYYLCFICKDGVIDLIVFEVKFEEELYVLIYVSWKDCSGIIVNMIFI